MEREDGKPIILVPHSGVQFLSFTFDLEAAPRGTRSFIERKRPDRIGPDGLPDVQLLPGYNESDPDGAPPFSAAAGDDEYDVSNAKALQPFVGRWVPMPFFALRPGRQPDGSPLFDQGPSNWARACLFSAEQPAAGSTHTLVLAFDTQLAPGPRGTVYDAPLRDDALNEREFALAHRFDDLGWFFRDERTDAASNSVSDYQEWLSAWLEGVFHDFKRAERPGRPFDRDSLDHRLEHVARYIAFVGFVERVVRPGSVKLVDTVSDEPFARPVAVDLVLDVGNSRTCGILIESHANEAQVDLGNSMVLQLRDLSRPDRITSDPFESHVELAQAYFGPESLSRRSGRARAFLWPSLVRVGPEAARLRAEAEGTERTSGLSSPKRYLWDTAPVPQPWSFQTRDYPDPDMPPLIQRAAARYLNPRGDVLSEVTRDRKLYAGLTSSKAEQADLDGMLTRLTFSRSSFFTFMVGEVVVQALAMINSPGTRRTRAFADAPRRLNRLILTLPTAMPVREQRIMRSRVEGALSLIWDLMGWRGVKSSILTPPELIVAWDEASCVQFVYLYSEIARKSGGDAQGFFELAGRPRAIADAGHPPTDPTPHPSLRIASVDIGGGTTDLMITTYHVEGRVEIKPSQTFRESFRVAGDDVLRAVVERCVVPAVERHLAACGLPEPHAHLAERFGGNRADMSEQDKHLRQQFVSRVLRPIGLDLLLAFENTGAEAGDAAAERRTLAELVAAGCLAPVPAPVAAYLAGGAARRAGVAARLDDLLIDYDFSAVRDAVVAVLGDVFGNIAEALNHFDPDVVLLAGRPSRLPATVDLVVDRLAVAPDRVLPLHKYRVGAWYPFKTRDNTRISDPKTATVVGGMLCALAQRQIVNLSIDTDRLTLRSTATVLGAMENSGRIRDDAVLFAAEPRPGQEPEASLRYFAPTRIGSRQLPLERWTATPLYKLTLAPEAARPRLPVTVTLQRGAPDEEFGFEEADKLHAGEARKEELKVVQAEDADGRSYRNLLRLALDTMAADEGYWLDTGILTVDG